MAKVKICGLSQKEDIEAVNKYKPDFAGFVFYPPSRRNVAAGRAAQLKKMLDPQIPAVGVFVDGDPWEIASLAEYGIIDMIQLHGSEDEDYIGELRKLTKKPLIQAFTVQSEADIEKAKKSSADYVLLDNGKGTGETFDWTLIRDIGRPFFLAGGLNADNVPKAVGRFHPYAVDISSGAETGGMKDPEKIRACIEAVRGVPEL